MLSVARAAIGALLIVAPGVAGGRWIGDVAHDRRTKIAIRGLGARDLALGLGALRALDRGEPVRPWAQLAALGDASDAVSSILAARRLGAGRTISTVMSAGAAAALGAAAASKVD